MRLVFLIILVSLVSLGMRTGAIAQNPSPSPSPTPTIPLTNLQIAAREEANAAAKAYREGKFLEAEQHARKAVELEPTNNTWRMFVPRTVHAQYRPGDFAPENVALGNKAIDEYRKILEFNPTDEESYKAVGFLYVALKEDEQLRDWVTARATNPGRLCLKSRKWLLDRVSTVTR